MVNKIKTFYVRNERHLNTAAFLLGFIWDNLTLTRVDLLYDNLVLTSYLVIAGAGIIIYNAYDSGRFQNRFISKISPWLSLVIQFAFGGLFSGYIIFYSRSASLASSWPFILFLLALFFGNELFKRRYSKLVFQISIFFIASFSYAIFSVPVLIKKMNAGVFVISGILSLLLVFALVTVLRKFSPERVSKSFKPMLFSVLGLFVLFNVSYFTNIIPPIPLSLKEINVFHDIKRAPDGNYSVMFEESPWYIPLQDISHTFRRVGSERVYVFSSVFAPTDLTVTLYHEWSYFDDKQGRWIAMNRIPFPITGGQSGGYRGYSYKEQLFSGYWRVDVLTERGQLVGRVRFKVTTVEKSPKLTEGTR